MRKEMPEVLRLAAPTARFDSREIARMFEITPETLRTYVATERFPKPDGHCLKALPYSPAVSRTPKKMNIWKASTVRKVWREKYEA